MINLILFICISALLVFIILALAYYVNIPTNDYEKHSAYECGFEPFGDARSFFDIHFYTIGLLFIIFDLEIVFLIPVVVDISNISFLGYMNLLIFLLIVIVGFYYEWAIGLLNWLPTKVNYNTSIVPISNSIFYMFFVMPYPENTI
jgi:NADH-quinone oxidoreductase subunit A